MNFVPEKSGALLSQGNKKGGLPSFDKKKEVLPGLLSGYFFQIVFFGSNLYPIDLKDHILRLKAHIIGCNWDSYRLRESLKEIATFRR